MNRVLISMLLLWSSASAQTVYFDNMEVSGYTWRGVPTVLLNSGYVSGSSAASDVPASSPFYSSATTSFRLLGAGAGSSSIEKDTLLYANVLGLDPGSVYEFRLRLAAFGLNPAVNAAAGADASDYVEIGYNSNGGTTFIKEIKVVGSSNSTWGFSALGQITKVASSSLTTYSSSTAAPYSRVSLTLPPGTTQAAFIIILSTNATGESWLVDDVELFRIGFLPVELLEFNGDLVQNRIVLTWATATETNNDFFLIERSTDGFIFTEMARVSGSGTSNSIQHYSWEDFSPCSGLFYYRLSQFDYDGRTEKFTPIAVQCKTPKSKRVLKIVNVLGEEVADDYLGLTIILYDDGSTQKQIK